MSGRKNGDFDEEDAIISFDYSDANDMVSLSPILLAASSTASPASTSGEDPAVSLLKRIFPDATASELQQLHAERSRRQMPMERRPSASPPSFTAAAAAAADDTVLHANLNTATTEDDEEDDDCIRSPPRVHRSVELGGAAQTERSPEVAKRCVGSDRERQNVVLPDSFLRLPKEIAVLRPTGSNQTNLRYELVKDLEQRAVSQHEQRYCDMGGDDESFCYISKVVTRNPHDGLGMTIVADRKPRSGRQPPAGDIPSVRVHSLAGLEQFSRPGAAMRAGVQCGDILIGMDGVAFAASLAPHESSLAQHAFTRLLTGPDPAVLHLQRRVLSVVPSSQRSPERRQGGTPAAAPTSCLTPIHTPSLLDTSDFTNDSASPMAEFTVHSDISSPTHGMDQNFSVPGKNSEQSIHPFIESLDAKGLVQSKDQLQCESRAVNEAFAGALQHRTHIDSTGLPHAKVLSVRIVNMFDDESNNQTAYTLWVYDIHAGIEWYAPFRCWSDFQDLRTATMAVAPGMVRRLPFPSPPRGSGLFRSPSSSSQESAPQKEKRARLLEQFIRSLSALAWNSTDKGQGAEIGIHLQSFLGGDEQVLEAPAALPAIIQVTNTPGGNGVQRDQKQRPEQLVVKQSVQYVTFRLFHLTSLRKVVDTFVDAFRASTPRLRDIEQMGTKGPAFIKSSAMDDLNKIQQLLDKLQEMILEGCQEDFRRMADSYYQNIGIGSASISSDEWYQLFREGVREQVEIEIYVPLRSCISRWLVHGWRYEDMEIQFKIEEMRKKPPSFFRIPDNLQCDWTAASKILSKGVGLSTLPTVKLRAIVEAAREIFRVYSEGNTTDRLQEETSEQQLGADDFLPIFIYCVVHAELERPCALAVLLRTLCDQSNRIGEIGYYLLSFEAAIAHCHEVDLTDESEHANS